MVKNSPETQMSQETQAQPGLGRPPGGGNGNPLQHSCRDNPMDREAWQATVHGVTKSWTGQSTHTHYVADTVAGRGTPSRARNWALV